MRAIEEGSDREEATISRHRHLWLAAACLCGFLVVLALVAVGSLDGIDRALWRQTVTHWHPRVGHASYGVINVLSPPVDAAVLVLAGLTIPRPRGRFDRYAATLATAAAVATVVYVLKPLLGRHGPVGTQGTSHGGSFPSGHTAATLVCYGALALLLSADRPQLRRRLFAVVAALTVVVGAALVYVAAHWLSDVIGSVLLASGALVLLDRWLQQRRRQPVKGVTTGTSLADTLAP